MLTRRGRAALVAFVVLLLAGRILGVTELFGIAVAIVVLVLLSVVRLRVSHIRAHLAARLSPEVIEAGQPTVLELFVENSGIVPSPTNRLQLLPSGGGRHRILVPRLSPGERATVTIGLDSSRRGRHAIAGYDAVMTDGLGLASKRLVSTGSVAYLVRPRSEELPHTLPLSTGISGQESTHSAADRLLTGASMLRLYAPGDDLRRVHWPTTARVGDIMVREGGDPDTASRSGTTIILGTQRGGGDRFERAVEVTASLAGVALREGMLRVMTTTGYDSGLAHGLDHLDEITLQLAVVQPLAAPGAHRSADATVRSGNGRGREAAPIATDVANAFVDEVVSNELRREEWNVLIAVEAGERLEDAELNPDVIAPLQSRVGTIVLVLVGGDVPRFERLSRNEVAVFLPVGRAMHDLWNTALDLPIGEVREVDAEQHRGTEVTVP